MIAQKSRVFRHEDTRASAMNIITYILDQHRTTVLDIQRQMVDEGKDLDQTDAGQELEKELLKQRELLEQRIQEAQEEMREAIADGNEKANEEATEQQDHF
jgi:protein-disulfide isomerase-like protein with CxxC motif